MEDYGLVRALLILGIVDNTYKRAYRNPHYDLYDGNLIPIEQGVMGGFDPVEYNLKHIDYKAFREASEILARVTPMLRAEGMLELHPWYDPPRRRGL